MYCTTCRGEFRPEITVCPTCQTALVAELPQAETIEPGTETVAVGLSGDHASLRVFEVEGRTIDLQKAFPYEVASELVRDLEHVNIPSVLRPLQGVVMRDTRPHFEVHVRPADQARAGQILHDRWAQIAADEAGGPVAPLDIEKCPACGAEVPLSAEECPDCGLGIGSAVGDEEDEEAPAT